MTDFIKNVPFSLRLIKKYLLLSLFLSLSIIVNINVRRKSVQKNINHSISTITMFKYLMHKIV